MQPKTRLRRPKRIFLLYLARGLLRVCNKHVSPKSLNTKGFPASDFKFVFQKPVYPPKVIPGLADNPYVSDNQGKTKEPDSSRFLDLSGLN